MTTAARTHAGTRAIALESGAPARIATWLFGAALVFYLGMRAGGYQAQTHQEVGLAVWWIVLVAAATGVLKPLAANRSALVVLGAVLLYALWTAASLSWTDSAERTATELARVSTYVGVLVLALGAAVAGHGRTLAHGVFSGLTAVVGIAVLSRLHPGWFPENVTGTYYPGINIEERLAYPLNYSSGLGGLAAMGLPLALWLATSARTIPARALAAATLPLSGACIYLTTSGGALIVAMVAVAIYLIATADRLPQLVTVALAIAGTLLLAKGIDQREALGRGLGGAAATREGHELGALLALVCVGVALMQAAITLAATELPRPRALVVPRRTAQLLSGGVLALLLVAAVAGPIATELSDRWNTFSGNEGAAPTETDRAEELLNFSGSGRYQFWESAREAAATDPWQGIGPGTFEFWWAQNGSYGGFIRDSHSFYFDSLAELGWPGLLLALLLVGAMAVAAALALRRASANQRMFAAAILAAVCGFAAGAATDWLWELAVIPLVALVLVAASARSARTSGTGSRIALGALAVAGLVAVALPLGAGSAVRDSEAAVRDADLSAALTSADSATQLQPYAATPRLQRALVLERAGAIPQAIREAEAAAAKSPRDWRPLLILARLRARAGDARGAVEAVRRGRALTPKGGIFR